MEAIKCIFENGYFKPLEDIDLKQKYFYIEIVEIRKESLKEVLKKGYKEMYEDSLKISEEWQSAEE
ncbi:MAG: antitoxin AF2212-like protein [Methanosarcinales archaeon]